MSIQKYALRKGNDKLLIMRKGENLSDDFSYTESGNNITITAYNGNNTDVKIVDKFKDTYVLVRPESTYKKYTITYDETEYTATPEEGYGLVITDTTKQDVDLSTDFIIT